MRFFGRRQTEADDARHGGNAAALAEQIHTEASRTAERKRKIVIGRTAV